jgi:hypothetical protein
MAIPFLTNIDLKNNQLLNAKLQNLAEAPELKEAGKIYFDTTVGKIKYYDGVTEEYIAIPKAADITIEISTAKSEAISSANTYADGKVDTLEESLSDTVTKAASAIQGVKVGDTEITPDENNVVAIPEHLQIVKLDSTNATTEEKPEFGDVVSVIGGVTTDSYGHVTKIETKNVSIPELPENKTLTVKVDGADNTTYDTTEDTVLDLTALATKTYVGEVVAANDAMVFKGTIGTGDDATVNELPSTYKEGWTYRVVTAGTYAGQVCEVGDLIIALAKKENVESVVDSDWTVAQTNIDGAITGIKVSGDDDKKHLAVTENGSVVTIELKDSNVTAGTYNNVTVDEKGFVTAGENVTYLTEHPSTETSEDTTEEAQTLDHSDTFTVVAAIERDDYGHVRSIATKNYTLPGVAANTAKKAVVAIPAGDTIELIHNLGIEGVEIGDTTVYPATVSIYDVKNNQAVYADIKTLTSNTVTIAFATEVAANEYYAVIVG